MSTIINLENGTISGEVTQSKRILSDLAGIFADEAARAAMDQDQVIYNVQMHECEKEGTAGGLLFGTSLINPGNVGGEYFMTKGHYHAKRDTAEYYFCISGCGALILMDEQGKCWFEPMARGTLHYIPRSVAHRLANTGGEVLAVGCCWGADCGHDYATIATTGFSKRLMDVNGEARLV